MCGLAGIAGDLRDPHLRIFDQLMYMASLRGEDASGVATVGYGWQTNLAKTIGDYPGTLRYHKQYRDLLNTNKSVLIGHCRAATVGSNKPRNAHPFRAGKYLGVHNGTLDWSAKARLTRRVGSDFDTDSETLYWHMDEYGIKDTIEETEGAYALVFLEEQRDEAGNAITGLTLNFIRNDQRTLFLYISEDNKIMAWSSEYYMLAACLSRNGIDPTKGSKIFPLPINELWSFPLDKTITGNDWSNVTKTAIEGFKKPTVHRPPFQGQSQYYPAQGKAYGYGSYDDSNEYFGYGGSRFSRSNVYASPPPLPKPAGVEETVSARKVEENLPLLPPPGGPAKTPDRGQSNVVNLESLPKGQRDASVSNPTGDTTGRTAGGPVRVGCHPNAVNPITKQAIVYSEFQDAAKVGCASCASTLNYQKARAGLYRITNVMDMQTHKIGLEIYCEMCADNPETVADIINKESA